jgi:hypothetical protein
MPNKHMGGGGRMPEAFNMNRYHIKEFFDRPFESYYFLKLTFSI